MRIFVFFFTFLIVPIKSYACPVCSNDIFEADPKKIFIGEMVEAKVYDNRDTALDRIYKSLFEDPYVEDMGPCAEKVLSG